MCDVRVSVIMPAYRCANTIGAALDSLLAQTRQPDEIIVVDDGSPDDLTAALAPYCDRIRLIHKENGGASSARNAGLDIATGNIIAFLDADDFWHPQKLQSQLEIMQQFPELGLVACRYHVKVAVGEPIDYPLPDAAEYDCVLRPRGSQIFDMAMLIWTGAVIFRKSVLGADRFDVKLKIAEDRDLWVRLVARAPMYLQSLPRATLTERPGSLSRSDLDLDCQCMLQMIRKHADVLGPSGLRRWEIEVYRRWAGTYLALGRANKAIRPALRRLMYQPFSAEGWWVLVKSGAYVAGGVKRSLPEAEAAHAMG